MIESLSHAPGASRFSREIGHRQFQPEPQPGPPPISVASGKVEFFDAKLNSFVEIREKLIECHHAESVIFRRARDEAMVTPQVAKCTRDLEPETIQMIKLQ